MKNRHLNTVDELKRQSCAKAKRRVLLTTNLLGIKRFFALIVLVLFIAWK